MPLKMWFVESHIFNSYSLLGLHVINNLVNQCKRIAMRQEFLNFFESKSRFNRWRILTVFGGKGFRISSIEGVNFSQRGHYLKTFECGRNAMDRVLGCEL